MDYTARPMLADFDLEMVSVNERKEPDATIQFAKLVDADAIVLDSYTWTTDQIQALRQTGLSVIMIDDLADRMLPVDAIVNASPAFQRSQYRALPETRFFLGPQFALLDSGYGAGFDRNFNRPLMRLLVTLGGTDVQQLSFQLARWSLEVLPQATVDVVVGGSFSSEPVNNSRVNVHQNLGSLRELMLQSDAAVCGGGHTQLELAPTATTEVALLVADNPSYNVESMSNLGCCLWIGSPDDHDLEGGLKSAIRALDRDPGLRSSIGTTAHNLIDGFGAHRVASELVILLREKNRHD